MTAPAVTFPVEFAPMDEAPGDDAIVAVDTPMGLAPADAVAYLAAGLEDPAGVYLNRAEAMRVRDAIDALLA